MDSSTPLTATVAPTPINTPLRLPNSFTSPGTGLSTSSADTVGFVFSHFLTDHIAVSTVAGVPPTFKLYGHGTIKPPGPAGALGSQNLSDPAFRALAVRSARVRCFMARTLATPFGLATSSATLKAVFAPEAVPAGLRTRGGALHSVRPKGFYHASLDLAAIEDSNDLEQMEQRYADLTIPVDVLFGRDDVVLDWMRHGDAQRRRSSRVTLDVVNGSHMLPVTAPSATSEWLRAAIARTTQAAPAPRAA